MAAHPIDFTPMWKTPTRQQAVEILTTCRAWTDEVVRGLSPAQRRTTALGGGGDWTVKDLLGHLATHERRALLAIGAVRATAGDRRSFDDTHAFNAHHVARTRAWSLPKVERFYTETRDELVEVILAMDDDRWREKIPHGSGRSALGLALGKMLNGDKFGLYAHDLAHRRSLERAIASISEDPPAR